MSTYALYDCADREVVLGDLVCRIDRGDGCLYVVEDVVDGMVELRLYRGCGCRGRMPLRDFADLCALRSY